MCFTGEKWQCNVNSYTLAWHNNYTFCLILRKTVNVLHYFIVSILPCTYNIIMGL